MPPIEWKYVGETSFEGTQVAQAEQEDRETARYNQGVQEIMSRHLQRQALRAQEFNSVPEPEVPQGFTPGTGDSVTLAQPLPPRNPAPGGLLPLSVPGSKELRGYMTPDGEITPAGRQATLLRNEGLLDDDGLPTEKAKAFMMDPETAMRGENLPAFMIRDQAGLNRAPDQSWGETFATMAMEVGGAVSAMHKLGRFTGADKIYDPFQLFAGDGKRPDAAEAILTGISFAEGSLTAGAPLAAGGMSAPRKLAAFLKGDTEGYYAAKQQHERDKDMLQTVKLGDFMLLIDDSAKLSGAVNHIQEATRGILGDKAPEIERHGKLAGSIIGDPANFATAGTGFLFGTASKGPAMFKMAASVERAAIARATASRFAMEAELARGSATRTVQAAKIAAQRADDLRGMGQQLDRAARLESTAARLATHADTQAKAFPVLAEKAKASMMLAEKLTQQAGGADAVLAMMQATKAARAVPFEVVGKTLEGIGEKAIKISDDATELLSRHGVTPEALAKIQGAIGPVGGATIGAAFGGPVGAFIGGTAGRIGQAFASGPVIKQFGQFARTVGRELVKERGSVPFWQRVANNTELSPVSRATAHLFDMATLGGRAGVPVRALKKGAQGAALTAPMNVAFETIADSGEITEAGLQRGIAGAMIFVGGPATLGGLVQGTLLAKRSKMAGNEINFRQTLPADQAPIFGSMPQGARRVVTETAAAFPTLAWKFTEGPNSFYDPRANTIVVGKNTNRILEAVVAHEVSHTIGYKGQMEAGITAALVGTEGTGGLFRSKDGTLDPHFREFMDTYNRDAEAQGVKPLTVEEAAVEYFTDSTVSDILGKVESGDMQKMAGRTQARRIASELGRAVIGKSALLSDLFYKIGGATDKGGNLVQGTGILQDGIRTLPGAQRMIREYMREKAGRTGDGPAVKGKEDSDAPIPLELAKASKPLLESLSSTFQADADGNVIFDSQGRPRFNTKETEIRRERAGNILKESIQSRAQAGEIIPDGSLRPAEGGKWEGKWIPEHAIKDLSAAGVFNGRQIATLRLLNGGAKRNKGERYFLTYQPASYRNRAGKIAYGTLAPTFRDVVPVATTVTKDGNILFHLLSVTQLEKNITKRAKSARGKSLYGGDVSAILTDAQSMMDMHARRGESLTYFREKYAANAEARLNFINSIFGVNTPEQRKANPLFDADKIPAKDGVYKTYRLDRINQATRLQGVPMPFQYEPTRDRLLPPSFRLNFAPNGIPEPMPSPAPRANAPAFGGELLETR